MHKICKLIEQVELEFETTEDYIVCASKTSDSIKSIYKELADDELDHVEKLLEVGDKQDFTKESKEADIWEFEKLRILKKHSKLIAELTSIK